MPLNLPGRFLAGKDAAGYLPGRFARSDLMVEREMERATRNVRHHASRFTFHASRFTFHVSHHVSRFTLDAMVGRSAEPERASRCLAARPAQAALMVPVPASASGSSARPSGPRS